MQLFGLVGFLVTMAVFVWWVATAGPVADQPHQNLSVTSSSTTTSSASSSYSNIIDAAETAAGALSR